jgi:hypothetical protein
LTRSEELAVQRTLTLDHEMPYYQSLPNDVNIWEGAPQHVVLAKVEGYDLFFWISAYILDGRTTTGFLANRALALGSIVYLIPHDKRGRMNDNVFSVNGFDPADYLDITELLVNKVQDAVVWKIRDVKFTCRPPYWDVHGSHAGLEFDLSIKGKGPTSFFAGDFDNLLSGEKWASFDQLTTCTGHISIDGRRHEISNGYGCHEHFVSIFDDSLSVVDLFRENPTTWFVGGNNRVQFQCTAPNAQAHVLVDEKSINYIDSQITIDVLSEWIDPRNHVVLPCKWHVNMRSDDGIIDLTLSASSRANRMWALRNGYILDVWMMGTADGVFIHSDGRSIHIKDMLFTWEVPRTVCP